MAVYVIYCHKMDEITCACSYNLFYGIVLYGGKLLVAHLVGALCYKPERRGLDSRGCHWNFSLT